MDYTITLTATQVEALSHITPDIKSYLQNFASNRGDAAIEDLVQLVVHFCFANDVPVPATKDLMVTFAFEHGLVITAAEHLARTKEEALNGISK